MKKLFSLFLLLLPLSGITKALSLASFNVESPGAEPKTIAKQVKSFNDIQLWALVESTTKFSDAIITQLKQDNRLFDVITGTTGRNQKLQVVYDTQRFSVLDSYELHDINPNKRVRSPLVVHLLDKDTNQEFLYVVNHLYRSNNQARHEQASQLNLWAQQQDMAVIQAGDFNFDLNPKDPERHDRGFDNLTRNQVMVWAKPEKLLPTQCSSYHSILDFVFVNQIAKSWVHSSKILFDQDSYCPDSNKTSDHRPIMTILDL